MLWQWWQQIYFEQPYWAIALACIPFFFRSTLFTQTSAVATYSHAPKLLRISSWLPGISKLLFLVAFASTVVIATKPFIVTTEQTTSGEGIDIVLCMDISGSMTEKDFLPNRLEAAKAVAKSFVEQRIGDRIGLVIFSAQAFTLSPLSTQHATLLQQLATVQSGMLGLDGTAIGTGLATSVVRLTNTKVGGRVIVLLTDGNDFGGRVPSNQAIALAQQQQVKVYTIGINNANGEKHELLEKISMATGGKYFEANNEDALRQVYNAINTLEKSTITVQTEKAKKYSYQVWLYASALAWFGFVALQLLRLRIFPLA